MGLAWESNVLTTRPLDERSRIGSCWPLGLNALAPSQHSYAKVALEKLI
jgi:hypothetical protein